MARQRDLLLNFERVRREMDELFGDVWGEGVRGRFRPQAGFSPRVDVYYSGEPPRAVVKAELAGVSLDTISLEIVGRELVIRGERHTVVQALNRQLTHHSYHVGQIVFLAKHLQSDRWKTLSLPRRRS